MGTDKAFLTYQSKPFVKIITEEMQQITDDLIVVIGSKKKSDFAAVLDPKVRILEDKQELGNPIGGMLTGFETAIHDYIAVLACDSPLVRNQVVKLLFKAARNYDAAVPIWEDRNTEPLCAVYNKELARRAAMDALRMGKIGPKNLLAQLVNVNYVDVSKIRKFDPTLASLINVNSKEDYARLLGGNKKAIPKSR